MAVYLADLARHQRADELVQRPHPAGGALMAMHAQPSYVRRALAEPEPPPTASGGAARPGCGSGCSAARSTPALTLVSLPSSPALDLAGGEVPAHRCGLGRSEPRRLPAGNGRARGRRLLAVHRRQVSPVHVRLLSARRSNGGSISPMRSASLLLVPLLIPRVPYKAVERDPVLRRVSGRRLLPAGRRRVRAASMWRRAPGAGCW